MIDDIDIEGSDSLSEDEESKQNGGTDSVSSKSISEG
jgi:hypothetical protein